MFLKYKHWHGCTAQKKSVCVFRIRRKYKKGNINTYKMEDNASGDLNNVKSMDASRKSFITFFNNTQKKVDVIWINYVGNPILYKTLLPGQYLEANTFVTHPWIFKDSDTNDRLVVDSKELYFPTQWNGQFERMIRRENQMYGVPQRTPVHITLPVYSLLERTMQVIRNCLRDTIIQECLASSNEAINRLELPETLQAELIRYIKNSFQHQVYEQ